MDTMMEAGMADWDGMLGYGAAAERHGYIIAEATIGDCYSGDYIFLVQNPDNETYGVITTGYGSCETCDVMDMIASLPSDAATKEFERYVASIAPTWYSKDKMLEVLKDSKLFWWGNLYDVQPVIDHFVELLTDE